MEALTLRSSKRRERLRWVGAAPTKMLHKAAPSLTMKEEEDEGSDAGVRLPPSLLFLRSGPLLKEFHEPNKEAKASPLRKSSRRSSHGRSLPESVKNRQNFATETQSSHPQRQGKDSSMGSKPTFQRKPCSWFCFSSSSFMRICTITVIVPTSVVFFLLLLFSQSISIDPPLRLPCTASSAASQRNWSGDLRRADFAWNKLCFGRASETLRLAVFSKKWLVNSSPGGMERHAHTLYNALAAAGHTVHVFTVPADASTRMIDHTVDGTLNVHFISNDNGVLDLSVAWGIFTKENSTMPFDFVHTESVALPHWRARALTNLAATWHGIAYEGFHSYLFQDLIRAPTEPRSSQIEDRIKDIFPKLLEEIRFFSFYPHHIGISDSAGEILRNIYQLPSENVHIILNGVDHNNFYNDPETGNKFRREFGVPDDAKIVMGVAGRLVKDKGHPILFEAFSIIRKRFPDVYLLIAGSGPWEGRYRELAPNVKVLGPLAPSRLAEFYNALDVFVNPTLRPQGLDLTLMEAMHCGKPILATNFPSIIRSVVLNDGFGYTFSPNVKALTEAMELAIRDGREKLAGKGLACQEYALSMFTAKKMAAAYERFFLCMKNAKYCQYPLNTDQC